MTLVPGVYMACSMSYHNTNANLLVYKNSVDGQNIDGFTLTAAKSPGAQAFSLVSTIFFVDSTIWITKDMYNGNPTTAQFRVYRITPPGYWHL